MDKRTFVGLCAALAFAVGSPGAYALKIFEYSTEQRADSNGRRDEWQFHLRRGDAVGREWTNVTDASDDSDTATYYNIGGTDVNLVAPVGIAATGGDTYVVTFTLDGMVFQTGGESTRRLGPVAPSSLATGGASGDKLVVFRLTSGVVATTGVLNLEANFAITGNAGTATMTIKNQTLASLGHPGRDRYARCTRGPSSRSHRRWMRTPWR